MAAEIFTDLPRATDANGSPLSGATWSFYASGTSTPLNVYSSATLATSLGAVVTADSGGQFVPIYFNAGLSYRAVLKTAGGATLRDIDPVNVGVLDQLSSPTGAAMVGFLQSGTGAVARTVQAKERDIVSVKDFGAVGNGTTDDTSAIQAAIDSFGYTWSGSVFNTTYAPRSGKVILPAGKYRCTGKLRLAPNIVLEGSGRTGFFGRDTAAPAVNGTEIIFDYVNTADYAVDTAPYVSGGTRSNNAVSYGNSVNDLAQSAMCGVQIRNITFRCATENSLRLFNMAACQQFTLEGVTAYKFLSAGRSTATWMSVIRDCQFYTGWRGWEAGHSVNNLVLDNVTFSRVGMTAIDTQATNQGDPYLNTGANIWWQSSIGLFAYDYAYVTGQGVTIEGYDRTIMAVNYSNVDLNSVWVEYSKFLITNNYSVIDVRFKFVIHCEAVLDTFRGRNRIENQAYNDEDLAFTTGYTKVLQYLEDVDVPDTVIIGFPGKVAGDTASTLLRSIYRTDTVVSQTVAWTPSLRFGGTSAGTQTGSGRLTRVGDLVFASFYISLTTKGAATGAATVTGLPYTALDEFGLTGVGQSTFGFSAPAAGTLLTVQPNTAAVTVTGQNDTHFSTGADFRGTVIYHARQNLT